MTVKMAEPATSTTVHRCRFVDFTPSAITALAFPPPLLPPTSAKAAAKAKVIAGSSKLHFDMLAIGRANGNIEIAEWTPQEGDVQAPQAWTVRKTLSGPYPSKVDSLAFAVRYPGTQRPDAPFSASDLRLFSSGGGSELVEWDLASSRVRRTISSQGGAIWSFAVNPASTHLALGCEDGIVRILSLEHDTLEHYRRFDRSKSRILSIAWGPPSPRSVPLEESTEGSDDDDEDEWTDEWIVTGGSDSAVSKWDVRTGRIVERMAADKVRGERTLVWTVGVLGDGTIISGDSLGNVKFWDARTCTQLHSFQAHGADVLCLTIGHEGTAVYTSGVDQKITQFALIKASTSDASSHSKWVQTTSRRLHSHDVRALAAWPPYTPLAPVHQRHARTRLPTEVAPILASGGLDMSVVLTPAALARATAHRLVNPLGTSQAATFEDGYQRRIAYATGAAGTSALRLARTARVLMLAADAAVSLWRIAPRPAGSPKQEWEEEEEEEEEKAREEGWEKILEMELNVQTNIIASAISDDASWLVVSDAYETKLFSMALDPSGNPKPKRARDFSTILRESLYGASGSATSIQSTGGTAFAFTPDSSKLVMASTSADVLVVDLGSGGASDGLQSLRRPRVLRKFAQHRQRQSLGRVLRGRMSMSEDGNDEEQVESPSEQEDEDEDGSASITRMAISHDGQWLATTDDQRRTHVFNLDAVQHHCVLPSTPQPVHALIFDNARPHLLLLGLAHHGLQAFDVEARQQPDWARWLSASVPARFAHLHDALQGVCIDPGTRSAPAGTTGGASPCNALFWGATWLCKVTLDAPPGWGGFSKKRRRGGPGAQPQPQPSAHTNGVVAVDTDERVQNFKLVTHYRPILFVDYLAPGELVVIERPLVDVLAKLPPAYFKAKYGAS